MAGTKKQIYIATDSPAPNIVDNYSTYTYNITFSMLPQSFWYSGILPIGTNRNKIVIAQTGVTTKFNIDNLQIITVNDNYGATFTSSTSITTKATFEITEPLGSSLVSLMTRGFHELKNMDQKNGNTSADLYDPKNKAGPLDLMYLLEVDLIGQRGTDASGEFFDVDHDLLGTDVGPDGSISNTGSEIFGKYAWPVYLTQFDFKPDHEGTRYNFEVVSKDIFAKQLPRETRMVVNEVKLEGTKVDEMFSQLSTAINKNILSANSGAVTDGIPKQERCHEVEIKLGEMYGSEEIISAPSESDWKEKVQELSEKEDTTESVDEVDAPATTDGPPPVKKTKIDIADGTTIERAIYNILARSINYINYVTPGRKFDPKDGDKMCYAPLNIVYSAKIERSTIAEGGSLAYTGGPKYKITYIIDMHLQAGVQVEKEVVEDEKTQKEIVDKWAIIKQYDYMFTGLNDQVMDVDISFPRGQTFLFPEHGGIKPSYKDSSSAVQSKDNIDKNADKATTAVTTTADENLIKKHLQELQSDLQTALSTIKQDGVDFLLGIQQQVKGSNALKISNDRLPSSPAGVFAKVQAIKDTTEFFDKAFSSLLEFQQTIEETASDFAGGVNLTGEIARIVKEAATPFEFTTTKFGQGLQGAIDSVGGGLDGLADTLSDATGFSISANDIPGISEVRDVVAKLDDLMDLPTGFNPGTIGGGGGFELLTSEVDEVYNNILEEFDFNDQGVVEEPAGQTLEGQATTTPQQEPGQTAAQHYFSTVLTYGKNGIPYLNRLDLNIKGDPFWIGKENYVSKMASSEEISLINREGKNVRWKPEFSTDRSDVATAAYDAGSLFVAFRYLFPKEYSNYQEDPALHTGEIERSSMDLTYSGYYMVVRAEHNFAQGRFTTNLGTVKLNTHPNEVVFSDDLPPGAQEAEQEDANVASQSAAISNTAEASLSIADIANEGVLGDGTSEGRIAAITEAGYIAGNPPPTNIADTFVTSADFNGVVDPIPMDIGRREIDIVINIPNPRIPDGSGG